MPISFPSSPTTGQTYTYNNRTWIYNGSTWDTNSTTSVASAVAPITYNASTQTVGLDRTIIPTTTSTTALTLKANPLQAANLQEWQNNSSVVLGSVDAVGNAAFQNANYAGKNLVINGAFDFWQRGTSVTNSTGYLADRWGVTANTSNNSVNQSRVSAPFASGFTNALRVVQANTVTVVEIAARQPIEKDNVTNLAGKQVTLSFWYRSNKVGTHGARVIGTVDNTGGVDQNLGFTVTTADVWARYTLTFSAFATITAWGTTAGNGVGAYVDIGLRTGSAVGFTSVTANDYFELTGVQLEIGSVATPFSRAGGTLAGELAACQRYYEKSYNIATAPGAANDLGNAFGTAYGSLSGSTTGNIGVAGNIPFKVTKRAAPAIVPYDYDGTANAVRVYPSDSKKIGLTSFANIRESGAYQFTSFNSSSGVGISSGNFIMFHWTADAEL